MVTFVDIFDISRLFVCILVKEPADGQPVLKIVEMEEVLHGTSHATTEQRC